MLARFGRLPNVAVENLPENVFFIQVLRGAIRIQIDGAGAPVFEWWVTATEAGKRWQAEDWVDYTGYEEGITDLEHERDMAGDLSELLTVLVELPLVLRKAGTSARFGKRAILYGERPSGFAQRIIPLGAELSQGVDASPGTPAP